MQKMTNTKMGQTACDCGGEQAKSAHPCQNGAPKKMWMPSTTRPEAVYRHTALPWRGVVTEKKKTVMQPKRAQLRNGADLVVI